MWRGHTAALIHYGMSICDEWRERGYKDSVHYQLATMLVEHAPWPTFVAPPWLGDEAFHASHRSNLLRKDPHWYGRFGWSEPNDLPYVWPTC